MIVIDGYTFGYDQCDFCPAFAVLRLLGNGKRTCIACLVCHSDYHVSSLNFKRRILHYFERATIVLAQQNLIIAPGHRVVYVDQGVEFRFVPCSFCAEYRTSWVMTSGRSICHGCFTKRNPPDHHYILPLFERALVEFTERGLVRVSDNEFPIERCFVEKDMDWLRSLA